MQQIHLNIYLNTFTYACVSIQYKFFQVTYMIFYSDTFEIRFRIDLPLIWDRKSWELDSSGDYCVLLVASVCPRPMLTSFINSARLLMIRAEKNVIWKIENLSLLYCYRNMLFKYAKKNYYCYKNMLFKYAKHSSTAKTILLFVYYFTFLKS